MDILFFGRSIKPRLRIFIALLLMTILFGLFVLGAQPFAVGLIPVPWDKVAHGGVFAVLAISIGLGSGWHGWRMMLLMTGGALLLGGLDEWHQFYLPGRHAEWEDLAADGVGGLVGALLLGFGIRRRHS